MQEEDMEVEENSSIDRDKGFPFYTHNFLLHPCKYEKLHLPLLVYKKIILNCII